MTFVTLVTLIARIGGGWMRLEEFLQRYLNEHRMMTTLMTSPAPSQDSKTIRELFSL